MTAADEIPVLDGQTTIEDVLPPKRVQRRRVKGWRMPENTVYVGRGSHWGNHCVVTPQGKNGPFDVEIKNRRGQVVGFVGQHTGMESARHTAKDTYRRWVQAMPEAALAGYLEGLAGKNLACWCPPEHACHADVLLELANPKAAS